MPIDEKLILFGGRPVQRSCGGDETDESVSSPNSVNRRATPTREALQILRTHRTLSNQTGLIASRHGTVFLDYAPGFGRPSMRKRVENEKGR